MFYLGTHQPGWLGRLGVPLFVSDRRLRGYRTLPRAAADWSLDSGGFTELSQHGSWNEGPTPAEYAARVRRYADEVGRLQWAAPQDWMCEPFVTAKTGLTVREHQRRTVGNLVELRAIAPDLPFVPVLQGYRLGDYLTHLDDYAAVGVDLAAEAVVGVGSVCRRQKTGEVRLIFETLADAGLRNLHGFGLKKVGLAASKHLLASADSLAWSYDARRAPRLDGCEGHRRCQNCSRYALGWRADVIASLPGAVQPSLWEGAA